MGVAMSGGFGGNAAPLPMKVMQPLPEIEADALTSFPGLKVGDVVLRRPDVLCDLELGHASAAQFCDDLFEVHINILSQLRLNASAVTAARRLADREMAKRQDVGMGGRLREARAARKLSQARLSQMTGVSQATISDIERGRNTGSTETAKLAAALGVSALWLSNGKGPRHGEAPIRPVLPQKQIHTDLLVQCMRAVTAFQQQAGSNLDDDDLLRLACRLYEQHIDSPTKQAADLLGYLVALDGALNLSRTNKNT